MRYTFIVYQMTQKGKLKDFEMLLVETYSDVVSVMNKVIGKSLMKNLFDDHTLREVKELPNGVIVPGPSQTFLDPLRVGNMVYVDLRKRVFAKQPVIMNKDGGYQTYVPDIIDSMGWKEIRREKRETLSFHEYTNKPEL